MKESIVNDYLKAIESASNMGSKSKSYKAFSEARVKLLKATESGVETEAIPSKWHTAFEELTCLGFYPQERRLTASLKIKRPYGYGGNLPGGIGTYQYVAFYVNWNGDSDFNDTGEDVCASYVHVFDPGAIITKTGPICYSVYRDIIPLPTLKPGTVVNVRAILSWQIKPTGPNFQPTWGNVINCPIRIEPIQ